MKIHSLSSTAANLDMQKARISGLGGVEGKVTKSLGEAPPILINLSEIGALASLFAPTGRIGRLRKRLNYLKKKNCKIIPAKGTIACVDDQDVVYLGIEFLEKYKDDEEILAGVLAHEWGHACALKPRKDSLQKLNWNQIFELRRAHETLADEISGRLLYMMGYTTQGIKQFLLRGKTTHTLKYHAPEIRVQVIEYGFQAEKKRGELARKLFPQSVYENEYHSVLLDIA